MPKTTGRVAPLKTTASRSQTTKATKRASVTNAKTAPAKKAAAAKKAPPAKKVTAVKKVTPAKKAAPAKKVTATKKVTAVKKTAPAKKVAPAKAVKPAKKGPVVLDKFLEGQRAALLEERATYTHQAESLQAEADLLAADREPGDVQFDEESGEGDTLAVERERDLALSAQARAAVDEIDNALGKIIDGTYGTCEQCGKSIPRERLRALPYATLCVQCKSMGLGRR
jgi:RNA polymerase-binding transcription factor DksA